MGSLQQPAAAAGRLGRQPLYCRGRHCKAHVVGCDVQSQQSAVAKSRGVNEPSAALAKPAVHCGLNSSDLCVGASHASLLATFLPTWHNQA